MRVDHAREIRFQLADPATLARLLGLEDGAKRQARGLMVRCPVHSENTPSCSMRVADDGTIALKCHACGWTGDALSLVAVVRGLDPQREFRRVLEEAASLCGYDLGDGAARAAAPPPRPRPRFVRGRPPRDEVDAFWNSCSSVTSNVGADVALFLSRRRIFPMDLERLDVLRVTPLELGRAWPAWWPERWSTAWRLVTRAYEPDGTLASLHARAVADVTPKTRWPYDCRADGLVFADRLGVELLRGRADNFDRVLVVEGLTDLAAAALWAEGRRVAVLGITSGSAAALGSIRWPSGVPVSVGTDTDDAGERYAQAVAAAIPKRITVTRWKNPRAA